MVGIPGKKKKLNSLADLILHKELDMQEKNFERSLCHLFITKPTNQILRKYLSVIIKQIVRNMIK